MLTSTGFSSDANAATAVQQALESARTSLASDQVDLALVFASSKYDQAGVVEALTQALPPETVVLGGSTAGEINTTGPCINPSVVVMLISWQGAARVAKVNIEGASDTKESVGSELVEQLRSQLHADPNLILTVADGLTVNPSAFLRGIASVLPGVPVVGGSSGDDGQYKQTFQYDRTLMTSSVTAAGLAGEVTYAVGVRHGWNPISASRRVTKAAGTVIHEIDGQPAIKLYEEFIGKDKAESLKEVTLAELALSYPLGVKDADSGEMLLRAPFYVDAGGSITCGGEVDEGAEVYLMMGNKEGAIEAARQSAQHALDALGTTPKAAVIFNCHVRDTLFASKDEAKKEIDAIKSVIGADVPMVGFYTYAEQAPIEAANYNLKTCNNTTHNETIVILLLA